MPVNLKSQFGPEGSMYLSQLESYETRFQRHNICEHPILIEPFRHRCLPTLYRSLKVEGAPNLLWSDLSYRSCFREPSVALRYRSKRERSLQMSKRLLGSTFISVASLPRCLQTLNLMAQQIVLPICSCCKRPLQPDQLGAKFLCPNCGEVLIWRHDTCRKQAVPYKCPKCGFQGP